MATKIKITVSIRKTLLDQAAILAQHLNIPRSRLFEMALEHFISSDQDQTELDAPQPPPEAQRIINQGDIYWVQMVDAGGLEPDIPHPHVVIQGNVLNHSRIATVVTCVLTSNRKRINMPGNILLEAGEANLTRQSVVEVSKVAAIEKIRLGQYIGTVDAQRVNQILTGLRFLQTSFFPVDR